METKSNHTKDFACQLQFAPGFPDSQRAGATALAKEYHDVLDMIYKKLNINMSKRRLDKFKNNLKNVAEKGVDALDNERARLMRRYESLKQEIQTYENNLGFLNASSKKGNSLIDEMNRKVQKLKDDMNLVREKIKAIDAENDN